VFNELNLPQDKITRKENTKNRLWEVIVSTFDHMFDIQCDKNTLYMKFIVRLNINRYIDNYICENRTDVHVFSSLRNQFLEPCQGNKSCQEGFLTFLIR
jgi:hypothetical protein